MIGNMLIGKVVMSFALVMISAQICHAQAPQCRSLFVSSSANQAVEVELANLRKELISRTEARAGAYSIDAAFADHIRQSLSSTMAKMTVTELAEKIDLYFSQVLTTREYLPGLRPGSPYRNLKQALQGQVEVVNGERIEPFTQIVGNLSNTLMFLEGSSMKVDHLVWIENAFLLKEIVNRLSVDTENTLRELGLAEWYVGLSGSDQALFMSQLQRLRK
jgi:hypothetical protein